MANLLNIRRFAKPDTPQYIAHRRFLDRKQRELSLPESKAIADAMLINYNGSRFAAINGLVSEGKSADWWNKLSSLFIFVADNQVNALLDWKNPSGVKAVEVNSPVFVKNEGYFSDGTTSHISTQISPTSSSLVSQNDAHCGGLVKSVASANSVLIGSTAALPSLRLQKSTTNILSGILNNSANINTTVAGSSAAKHIAINRTDAANYQYFVEGNASSVVAAVSSPVLNSIILVGKISTVYSQATISHRAVHWGAALTANQFASLNAALISYITTLGAVP